MADGGGGPLRPGAIGRAPVTVGVDLGGTKLLAAAVDADGSVLAEARLDTPDDGPAIADAIVAAARAAASEAMEAGHPPTEALGVGAASMVTLGGRLVYAPNLAGIDGVDLDPLLTARVPWPVVVDNDANVAAWGEVVHGAGRGVAELLLVTLGTGIGGGIITGGRLLRGARGFAAEIGHFTVQIGGPRCACGQDGHWEALASGTALGRIAREAAAAGQAPSVLAGAGGQVAAVLGEHVVAAARAGAADALALLAGFADHVALGLAGLTAILDPELILIGGGLVQAGDLLLDPVRAAFPRHLEIGPEGPRPEIRAAALGVHAGAVGAAALARAQLESPPA
jgi:glucokinase